MTHEEHFDLVQILAGNPWDVRTRLKAFVENAKVGEVHVAHKNPATRLVEALKPYSEPYPEYTGQPNFDIA